MTYRYHNLAEYILEGGFSNVSIYSIADIPIPRIPEQVLRLFLSLTHSSMFFLINFANLRLLSSFSSEVLRDISH